MALSSSLVYIFHFQNSFRASATNSLRPSDISKRLIATHHMRWACGPTLVGALSQITFKMKAL